MDSGTTCVQVSDTFNSMSRTLTRCKKNLLFFFFWKFDLLFFFFGKFDFILKAKLGLPGAIEHLMYNIRVGWIVLL